MSLTIRYAPIYKTRWRGQFYGPKLDGDHIYLPVDVSPEEVAPLIRAGQVAVTQRHRLDDGHVRGSGH